MNTDTQIQIDQLKEKLTATQEVLGLLTAWLVIELGQPATTELLNKLDKAQIR